MLFWLAFALLSQVQTIRPHPLMEEYNRAWVLEGQGKPDEAIPLLKQIIAKDKTFYRAYRCLVDAYEQKQDLGTAEQYFRQLLREDPRNGLPHYGLAVVSGKRGQLDTAARYYAACVLEMPQAHVCYVPTGGYRDKPSIAVADAEARIAANPSDPYGYLALATAYRERRQLEEVDTALIRGVEVARAFGDPEWIVAFERALVDVKRTGDRLSYIQEASRLLWELGDWEAWVETRFSTALLHYDQGNGERGKEIADACLTLARQVGHRRMQAEILVALAYRYSHLGNLETALEYLQQAKSLAGYRSYMSWAASTDMAKIYARLGDLPRQLECLEQGVSAAPTKWHEAMALREIGMAHQQTGDYVKALEYGRASVAMFGSEGFHWHAGAGLGKIAAIYYTLGDFETARTYHEQSLRSARKYRDIDEEERNLLRLGEISLELGKASEAITYFQQAVQAGKRNTDVASKDVANKAGELLGLGSAYRRLGDNTRARDYLLDGLKLARESKTKFLEATALARLGHLYLETGGLPDSEQSFAESLSIAEASGYPDLMLTAHRGLAGTAQRRGDHERALRELERAIERMESLRGRIRGSDLQSSFVQQNWKVYEDIIGLLARRGDVSGSFSYAERGRARAFLDTLEESKARVTKGLTPEQQRRQAGLFADLSKNLSSGNKADIEKAERSLADWVLDLRRTSPAYRELRYPEPFDAPRVQAEMARHRAVLLEYVLGDRQSYVWAVSGNRVRMTALAPRREVEAQVQAFRALVSRRPRGPGDFETLRAQSRRLYDLLIKPVASGLDKGCKVFIAPDGPLYYLPFEALLQGDGRYLMEDHTLAYVPSASVLGQLPLPQPGTRELLAYGDPDFGSGAGVGESRTSDLVRSVYNASGFRLPRLPNTRKEVDAITALYAAARRTSYLGRQATEASVKRERLSDYRRLHFATHAVVDDRVPGRSGVVLSLVNTGGEDGVLRMNEIFNLDLNADVVVLSACQTGLGKLMQGEGMVGLTRAFIYAGTPRVVVSLWEVNDIATADFMQAFYRHMAAGQSPGPALRAAKLEMLHSDVPAYRHPYFWTPFVLVGTF